MRANSGERDVPTEPAAVPNARPRIPLLKAAMVFASVVVYGFFHRRFEYLSGLTIDLSAWVAAANFWLLMLVASIAWLAVIWGRAPRFWLASLILLATWWGPGMVTPGFINGAEHTLRRVPLQEWRRFALDPRAARQLMPNDAGRLMASDYPQLASLFEKPPRVYHFEGRTYVTWGGIASWVLVIETEKVSDSYCGRPSRRCRDIGPGMAIVQINN
jgi:hypothetical protein